MVISSTNPQYKEITIGRRIASISKISLAALVGCLMPMMVGVCFLCPSMDCLCHKYHYCPDCQQKVADFEKSDICAVMDPPNWTQESFALARYYLLNLVVQQVQMDFLNKVLHQHQLDMDFREMPVHQHQEEMPVLQHHDKILVHQHPVEILVEMNFMGQLVQQLSCL